VAAGRGVIRLQATFPPGYAPNLEAPSEIEVASQSPAVVRLTGKASFSGAGPRFPMTFPADFHPGTTTITVNLSVVYCREHEAGVCLIHQARIEVPVTVTPPAGAGAGTSTGAGTRTESALDLVYQVE
jgi:hypothetical protein